MAWQNVDLAADMVMDITAILSLVNNGDYTLQALGGTVYLFEGATAPDLTADPVFAVIKPFDFFPFQQGTDNLYAWGNARLVVLDAV